MRLEVVLVTSLMMLAACATPVKSRYYALSGGLPPSVTAVVPAYRVAIGPVTLPEAVDRLQIVLRVAPNRYEISDAGSWMEPLKREIPRVIAENMGQLLPQARVAVHWQQGSQGADYRVLIDVLRFESVPGESVMLEAAWSVRDSTGKRQHEAHSVLVERVNSPEVSGLVTAHAIALDALSREIVDALNSLRRAGN